MKVNLKRSALMLYAAVFSSGGIRSMQDTIMNTGLAVLCMLCFTRLL